MEQVVPGFGSPLEAEESRQRQCTAQLTTGRKELNSVCQRSLPQSKQGVKPLDLFSGDEIFANHEE